MIEKRWIEIFHSLKIITEFIFIFFFYCYGSTITIEDNGHSLCTARSLRWTQVMRPSAICTCSHRQTFEKMRENCRYQNCPGPDYFNTVGIRQIRLFLTLITWIIFNLHLSFYSHFFYVSCIRHYSHVHLHGLPTWIPSSHGCR